MGDAADDLEHYEISQQGSWIFQDWDNREKAERKRMSGKKQLRSEDFEKLKQLRWAVYDPDDKKHVRKYGRYSVEDVCIITTAGHEVVGCSEWMRADKETLEHIVHLHNTWLTRDTWGDSYEDDGEIGTARREWLEKDTKAKPSKLKKGKG